MNDATDVHYTHSLLPDAVLTASTRIDQYITTMREQGREPPSVVLSAAHYDTIQRVAARVNDKSYQTMTWRGVLLTRGNV